MPRKSPRYPIKSNASSLKRQAGPRPRLLTNFSFVIDFAIDRKMILRIILFTLLAVASAKISPAQQASPTPTIGSTFDPVQATNAWLATVPADKRAKSDAYFE